jgi:ppGpp synthetase/RelA/SpoT-type nucleotidyltranferase
VVVDECPVEIQVRTSLQDLWAQAFEDLGEVLGRGIRYEEPPRVPAHLYLTEAKAKELVKITQSQSVGIATLEGALERLEQMRKGVAMLEGLCDEMQGMLIANLKLVSSFKD